MNIGGYDLIVNSERALGKVLDWARDKFPVKSEWDEEGLWIYLPGHNDHQGMIQIICGETNWTVVVDECFKEELDDYIENG